MMLLTLGKSKKSHGARSSKQGGCSSIIMFFSAKNAQFSRISCGTLACATFVGHHSKVLVPLHIFSSSVNVILEFNLSSSKISGAVNRQSPHNNFFTSLTLVSFLLVKGLPHQGSSSTVLGRLVEPYIEV